MLNERNFDENGQYGMCVMRRNLHGGSLKLGVIILIVLVPTAHLWGKLKKLTVSQVCEDYTEDIRCVCFHACKVGCRVFIVSWLELRHLFNQALSVIEAASCTQPSQVVLPQYLLLEISLTLRAAAFVPTRMHCWQWHTIPSLKSIWWPSLLCVSQKLQSCELQLLGP